MEWLRNMMLLLVAVMAVAGCKEDNKLGIKSIDVTNRPQLSTRNVSTLISDSGYTKYKVVTPLWNVYGGTGDEAFWDFPEGVYLRQLDHDLKVVSTVAADSACYFPNSKIWKLFGDVEIDQKEKAYFLSQRIFFDDKKKQIYSDTFIHIKTPTQVLEGIGFESNQTLTQYRVLKPTGMFPRKQFEGDEDGMGGGMIRDPGEIDRSFAPDPMGGPGISPEIQLEENL